MLNGIFKGLYKNHGVYWFGKHGYGDETNPQYKTIKEMRLAIDAKLQAEQAARPEHLKYWDTLNEDERRKWRKACQTTELSAAQLAYTNKPMNEKTLIVLWVKGQRIGSTYEPLEQVEKAFKKQKLKLCLIQKDGANALPGIVSPNDGSEPFKQTVCHYNVTK